MSVTIKSLADGTVPTPSAGNLVGPVDQGKSVLVKSMRFVNTGTGEATINVYFKSGTTGRRILPKDTKLPPGFLLVDDSEITLEASDRIEGGSNTSTVDYVISGVEREVV